MTDQQSQPDELGDLLRAAAHVAPPDPRFATGTVEFDPATYAPTYRVRIGSPGASSAPGTCSPPRCSRASSSSPSRWRSWLSSRSSRSTCRCAARSSRSPWSRRSAPSPSSAWACSSRRARRRSKASLGLMNFAMFPGWIFSGTFFSVERFPAAAQPVIQALPLTALNDALRAVMLDGAGYAALAPELAILAAWGVVSFVTALRIFRWQ